MALVALQFMLAIRSPKDLERRNSRNTKQREIDKGAAGQKGQKEHNEKQQQATKWCQESKHTIALSLLMLLCGKKEGCSAMREVLACAEYGNARLLSIVSPQAPSWLLFMLCTPKGSFLRFGPMSSNTSL